VAGNIEVHIERPANREQLSVGHIQRRAKDKWRARYIGPDGRERSKTFARKVDAERYLATVEVSKVRGEWVDPQLGRTTFARWAQRWFGTTVMLKPKTRAGYESLLRTVILPTFAGARLAQIQPVDVREWISELTARGLSASRIRQAYHMFGAIMRSAVESGYIARSPCVGVKLPRMTQLEMLFLSAEQVGRLADEIAHPYGVLVLTLAYGGMRWGEAVALRRSRCDLLHSKLEIRESLGEVNGQLHFGPTKTYAARSVLLPPFLRDAIAEHLEKHVDEQGDALVFTAPNGGPLRNSTWHSRFWTPGLWAAGLPDRLRIHDLRHTCAALLISRGAHVKAVQRHLGHSSATVTLNTYAHLFPDAMERVVEGLEATYREAETACRRPGHDARVVDLEASGAPHVL
jgi:integrase